MQIELLSISQEVSLKDGTMTDFIVIQLASGKTMRASISGDDAALLYEEIHNQILAENPGLQEGAEPDLFEDDFSEPNERPEGSEDVIEQQTSASVDEDGILQI